MTDKPIVGFRRLNPGHGELTRYLVVVTPHDDAPAWVPGAVASFRGTSGRKSGAYWLAFVNGNGFQVLRHADVKTRPPIAFRSRKQATDALVLHVASQHPDIGPAAAHG